MVFTSLVPPESRSLKKAIPGVAAEMYFHLVFRGCSIIFFLFSRIVYVDTLSPYKHILQLHDTISLSVQRTEEGVSLYCAVAKKTPLGKSLVFFSGVRFCHENFPK